MLFCYKYRIKFQFFYTQSQLVRAITSKMMESENIGYKHPHATFWSKLTFWWMTPLFWKGYWEPLELEDLGNMHESDTCRSQYDRFLFIYRSSEVSEYFTLKSLSVHLLNWEPIIMHTSRVAI